jgi:tetratricopeptide (TPR) repeat protein
VIASSAAPLSVSKIKQIHHLSHCPNTGVHRFGYLVFVTAGLVKYGSGDYERALEFFNKALAQKTNRSDIVYGQAVYFYRGNVFSALKNHEKAFEDFNMAVSIQLNYYEAWINRGSSLSKIGRHEEAQMSYIAATKFNQRRPEAWYHLATLAFEAGDFEDAAAYYDSTCKRDPKFYAAMVNEGSALVSSKEFNSAKEVFWEILTSDNTNSSTWFHLANSYVSIDSPIAAIQYYDSAIYYKPNYLEAFANKSNLLADLKRYDDALNCLDEALRLDSNDYKLWYNMGYIKSELEDYAGAVICFQKSLRLNNNFASAWDLLGFVYAQMNELDIALEYMYKSLFYDSKDPVAFYHLGWVFARKGENVRAKEMYDIALGIKPDFASVWHNLAALEYDAKNYELASGFCDSAIKYDPQMTLTRKLKAAIVREID